MAIAAFSVTTPLHSQLYERNCMVRSSWATVTYPSYSKLTVPLCSPSSTAVVEDGPCPSADALLDPSESTDGDLPQSGCKACGREEIERGCNGEGRIQGGIAMVPGFGWWPIKAYRPCPGFVASGGRYRRQGQSMDEVAFGRGGGDSLGSGRDAQPSKKNEGPRKIKR